MSQDTITSAAQPRPTTGYDPTTPIPFRPSVGLWTLYMKEVRRFIKVAGQTLVAPLVTALLFMVIFAIALGRAVNEIEGVPFLVFLGPGLIMMTVVQNAFANTSSSLMIAKIQGNIVDLLMPPLSPVEMVAGLALGAITRGVMVGFLVWLFMYFWVDLTPKHIWAVLAFLLLASSMVSLLGLLAGIWAEKFDHMAVVTNFIITPLSFLSGTFYSVQRLPEIWYAIIHVNPFFYMIDGFRYGFTGQYDTNPMIGLVFLLVINVILAFVAVRLVSRGYKIKA